MPNIFKINREDKKLKYIEKNLKDLSQLSKVISTITSLKDDNDKIKWEDKMRKISTKNYVIYTIIVLITIAVVIFFSKWYEIKKDGQTTHRMNSIAEIKETDLDNYLVENPSIIIYLSNSHKEELKDFESEFNKYILKNKCLS